MTKEKTQRVEIKPPNFQTAIFKVIGTAPLGMNNFSQEAIDTMRQKMVAGSQAAKGAKRKPKDFEAGYQGAFNVSSEGWPGIPVSGIRQSLVEACTLCGFKLKLAKMCIFPEADGYDVSGFKELVKIQGTPERTEMYVMNKGGPKSPPVADLRPRPFFRTWSVNLRVKFDADQFTTEDIANLLSRVGFQIGWGPGRPASKTSCGQGWGRFRLEGSKA